MKLLQASCPRCGLHHSVPTSAVLLTLSPTARHVWWICRGCEDLVPLGLPEVAVAPLAAAGCHVITAPEHPAHPEDAPAGPPFDADDVLALHELLHDEEALSAALSAVMDAGEAPTGPRPDPASGSPGPPVCRREDCN